MTQASTIAFLSFFALCMPSAAYAGADCGGFISRLALQPEPDSVVFDIEHTYTIENGIVSDTYDAIEPIESECPPLNIPIVSATEIGLPLDTLGYKAVAAGTHRGTTWIQFVHPSKSGDGPGLSSSLVVYDVNGLPRSSIVVSSYHSWEGAFVLSSILSKGRLIRCEQAIEFFSYTDSGEIDQALAQPTCSPCDLSVVAFP